MQTIIDTKTGRILTTTAKADAVLQAGQVKFDPLVSRYDERRRMVFRKTPDLSNTLAGKVEVMRGQIEELTARNADLEARLTAIEGKR